MWRGAVVVGAVVGAVVVGLAGVSGVFVGCASTPDTPVEPAMTISAEASALQVTLVPSLPTSTVGQPLLLQMQVHNPTTSTQRFCTYHTLFEGLRNNLFTVTADAGDAVDYAGMMAKRAPPGPADFRDIAPGATVVSDAVDVTDGYALGAGRFTIVFDGNAVSGLSASAPTVVERRAP